MNMETAREMAQIRRVHLSWPCFGAAAMMTMPAREYAPVMKMVARISSSIHPVGKRTAAMPVSMARATRERKVQRMCFFLGIAEFTSFRRSVLWRFGLRRRW